MFAANKINEQSLENRFVPRDQDLGQWSSYLKKKNAYSLSLLLNYFTGVFIQRTGS